MLKDKIEKLLNNKIKFFSVLGIIFFLSMGRVALAEYQLHEKIPGQGDITTLQQYLEGLYKFGIAIVAILAVVMIAVGAFMYIVTSAGNVAKLANAKEIITSAIFGLVMALISWLILFVINPDLVSSAFNVEYRPGTDWVGDIDPDPEQCNQPNHPSLYENDLCSGDKWCYGDKCVFKKDICPFDLEKECSVKDDAQPEHPCGEFGDDFLTGTCTIEGAQTCPEGEFLILDGKKCINSVCCAPGF